jgi:hypothetical protein
MISEEIEKFLDTKVTENSYVKITFKKRDAVYGLFLKGPDFNDLKTKNFWRIVTRTNFDAWNKSNDSNLAKIFSGSDFTKLTLYTESFAE